MHTRRHEVWEGPPPPRGGARGSGNAHDAEPLERVREPVRRPRLVVARGGEPERHAVAKEALALAAHAQPQRDGPAVQPRPVARAPQPALARLAVVGEPDEVLVHLGRAARDPVLQRARAVAALVRAVRPFERVVADHVVLRGHGGGAGERGERRERDRSEAHLSRAVRAPLWWCACGETPRGHGWGSGGARRGGGWSAAGRARARARDGRDGARDGVCHVATVGGPPWLQRGPNPTRNPAHMAMGQP